MNYSRLLVTAFRDTSEMWKILEFKRTVTSNQDCVQTPKCLTAREIQIVRDVSPFNKRIYIPLVGCV